jgi:hypothetical protein
MPYRIKILLALALCGGVWRAQTQENALGIVNKDVQGLSKVPDGQQRRTALRDATTLSKTPGQNTRALPAERRLTPQQRAELRQQLHLHRNKAPI